MYQQLLRHKRALLLAPLAPIAATLVALTTTDASAATGCQATYSITSQWNTGFGAGVSITNLGSPVTSWTVAWTFPGNQQITQLWNGTASQSGQAVTVANASYNGSVGSNASVSFGFNGSYSGTNSVPSAISFNGVTCTGTVTPGSPTPTPTPTHSSSPSPSPSPSASSTPISPPPAACHASTCVQYNGGGNGVITESPKVYLVFYGSQWGGSGGSTQTQNEGFFKGLGTGGERWSSILTQYCNAVPAGTQTCPSSAVHIPYPTSSVYGGTWFDSAKPAPASPGDDLITEARSAASHFGVSDLARSIFVIFSPAGTSAGGGYSWHTTTSDGYNVVNAAYGEQNTIVTSHEYAETMSDVNGGWTTADKSSEIGDLCGPAGNLNLTTGSFPITSLWSNQDSGCVTGD
jgi:hypothetical protein